MGILALRIAGKKNGVSKLHGEVSRELFAEVWPNIAQRESPIDYVTNGIHTCSWLGPKMKELYNKYLIAYWQDNIHKNEVWEKVRDIPNDEIWKAHQERKIKLLQIVKENTSTRLKRAGYGYEQIGSIVDQLDPNILTIGFARRFATYKRATLIFKDLERITEILNKHDRPVQIIIAGKAHPADVEGQELIKQIHEISMKPQFKGKIFLLENYNIAMSRYLIAGVDIWLNTPRRPMEASGTSGQKASVNGVLNFSILDGWWAEGYNGKNGWKIGTEKEYDNYNIQDKDDSEDIYMTLENKIIPTYYRKNKKGFSDDWVTLMKESIITTGGNYSTARMLVDYTQKLYMPLINLYNNHYSDLEKVSEYNNWKQELYRNWSDIKITQVGNKDNITLDAGNSVEVCCKVILPNISPDSVEVQVYCGRMLDNGVIQDFEIVKMERIKENKQEYEYVGRIKFTTGGDFVYTFRVMPKTEMILDSANLNLVKWMEKDKKSELVDKLLEE
ncbi:MAG: alpha-glucan family phosphorylase [Clostridia bacterium]|nr:alpha-glucan family phosphorylase [Clostridia bacterium]